MKIIELIMMLKLYQEIGEQLKKNIKLRMMIQLVMIMKLNMSKNGYYLFLLQKHINNLIDQLEIYIIRN